MPLTIVSAQIARTAVAGKSGADRAHRRTRSTIVLQFLLPRRAQVTFLVQGPAPSCATARRLAVRGHRGLNRLRITGTARGRVMRPGIYRIVPQTARRTDAVVARVVRRGGIVAVPVAQVPRNWCARPAAPKQSEALAAAAAAAPLARAGKGITRAVAEVVQRQARTASPRGERIAAPPSFNTNGDDGTVQRLLALVFGVVAVAMLAATVLGSAWRGLRV
jgi:hypothetical protein